MSTERISDNQAQINSLQSGINNMHLSEPNESDIEKFKRLYLPESKVNYQPSQEKIERLNNLNSSKSEPEDSDIEKFKRLYLPTSKADYEPSEESIENVNNLNYPNM